jgi:redox-sensing transcriptional repressor
MRKPAPAPIVSSTGEHTRLSRAAAGRYSLYLRRLQQFLADGAKTISSGQIGDAIGVSDAQVRKDLACLGSLGHPGVGYPTDALVAAIRVKLGIDRIWSVVVVGVGNLARALLRYRGFQEQGFRIVALFDADPNKIGQSVEGLEIHAPERLGEVIAATGAELGLLSVPAEFAQRVADSLVAAGIRGVLNFAPVALRLPAGVSHVSVDLTIQFEQLAFLIQLGGSS